MKGSYLFGFIAALLVIVLGIFLLGRDGTEEDAENTFLTTPVEEALPTNIATNTDEVLEEPILEGVESATTSEAISLEEVEESDTGIVTYTDSGFSPKTITIEQGDSITFINNGSRNMWVASNFHPTHNEYPEESDEDCLGSSFDACTGVASGQSWTFTFDRIGEWGYHDHLNVSRTGTVIVE